MPVDRPHREILSQADRALPNQVERLVLTELGVIRPDMQNAVDGLKSPPTDIEPVLLTADKR